MTPARRRAILLWALAVIVAAAIALIAATRHRELPARPPGQRPTLLLLTSLPLVFGEDFSLDQPPSPALKALQDRYRVVPISVTSPADLAKGRLLLMAHAPAQTPENLVALDQWVRGGGKVALLADPMLEWPSKHPLGDPLRPPPMFMDTGLLAHWGLRLAAPGARGPKRARIGDEEVLTVSPGQLWGSCAVSADRIVAHCRVGQGQATVIADADFLDVGDLGDRAARNLNGLVAELAKLEQR
jgi:hypothetical protein